MCPLWVQEMHTIAEFNREREGGAEIVTVDSVKQAVYCNQDTRFSIPNTAAYTLRMCPLCAIQMLHILLHKQNRG